MKVLFLAFAFALAQEPSLEEPKPATAAQINAMSADRYDRYLNYVHYYAFSEANGKWAALQGDHGNDELHAAWVSAMDAAGKDALKRLGSVPPYNKDSRLRESWIVLSKFVSADASDVVESSRLISTVPPTNETLVAAESLHTRRAIARAEMERTTEALRSGFAKDYNGGTPFEKLSRGAPPSTFAAAGLPPAGSAMTPGDWVVFAQRYYLGLDQVHDVVAARVATLVETLNAKGDLAPMREAGLKEFAELRPKVEGFTDFHGDRSAIMPLKAMLDTAESYFRDELPALAVVFAKESLTKEEADAGNAAIAKLNSEVNPAVQTSINGMAEFWEAWHLEAFQAHLKAQREAQTSAP